MPKVATKTKSSRGAEYRCAICPKKIVAGEKYYEWIFRYGGPQRQHVEHGLPKASQLTQSKMSTAHAACESLENEIQGTDDPQDMSSMIQSCMDEIQSVIDEYEDAISNMPASEEQNRERIDMLQETIDNLTDAQSECDNCDLEELPEEPAEDAADAVKAEYERIKEENEQKINDLRAAIEEAAGNRSF